MDRNQKINDITDQLQGFNSGQISGVLDLLLKGQNVNSILRLIQRVLVAILPNQMTIKRIEQILDQFAPEELVDQVMDFVRQSSTKK